MTQKLLGIIPALAIVFFGWRFFKSGDSPSIILAAAIMFSYVILFRSKKTHTPTGI